jgi:hypothetical protein
MQCCIVHAGSNFACSWLQSLAVCYCCVQMAAAVKISTLAVNTLVHKTLVLMISCVSLLLQSLEAAAHGTRVNAIAPGKQHALKFNNKQRCHCWSAHDTVTAQFTQSDAITTVLQIAAATVYSCRSSYCQHLHKQHSLVLTMLTSLALHTSHCTLHACTHCTALHKEQAQW